MLDRLNRRPSMNTEEFVENLQHGIQELSNNLAVVEAQIKELKLQRKTIKTQIANNQGAIAAVNELQKLEANNES